MHPIHNENAIRGHSAGVTGQANWLRRAQHADSQQDGLETTCLSQTCASSPNQVRSLRDVQVAERQAASGAAVGCAAFTYDALGRRIEFVNDVLEETVHCYYDGVNEVYETNQNGVGRRSYLHGISYVDERLLMVEHNTDQFPTIHRPYYYVLDRMYNVRYLVVLLRRGEKHIA